MGALVTGATGLLGRALLAHLDQVTVLSRDPVAAQARLGAGVSASAWEPSAGPPPAEAFAGVDTIFHLAGEPVGTERWTDAKKHRIRESRVDGTMHLVDALAKLDAPPSVLVAASAIGYYGDGGDDELTETTRPGTTFMAHVCTAWEEESLRAAASGIRVVVARLGVVLSPAGGALARMLGPFRRGVGGRLGSGKQWMSWVHIDDAVGLLLHAAARDDLTGPVNVVAPEPVTNRDFTRALGRAVGRPAFLPVPRLGLRLIFGEVADILMESQRVVPTAALRTGYDYRYPQLEGALEACVSGGDQRQ